MVEGLDSRGKWRGLLGWDLPVCRFHAANCLHWRWRQVLALGSQALFLSVRTLPFTWQWHLQRGPDHKIKPMPSHNAGGIEKPGCTLDLRKLIGFFPPLVARRAGSINSSNKDFFDFLMLIPFLWGFPPSNSAKL